MEALLQPKIGLMVWTAVTFVLLLLVLTKTAWKPILDGLNKREGRIKSDLERAENAQKEAEALRVQFESRLADAQKTVRDMIQQAREDGDRTKSQILDGAKAESDRILERGRQDLADETERLKLQLQKEVSGLSVSIAEKVLERSVDKKIHEDVLKESLSSVKGEPL